ncbi:DegV family protein [Oceanobacillus piezotolerans]|uniref:DegV family protein n=1 Tax=Oceanobacillus piezotolerans TaxID=2448030 RepID=A0A498D6N7_9BACI|nr:DegV family protein [Oceanobacillus piezotolerans]RLL45106.1 DegV family protein [Oceanobacillus piezotolerans]
MINKKVAFVTDSTAYVPEELKAHPDVYVVPIVVISEGEIYEDGKDLTSEKLYEIIESNKDVPKTSQPSVGVFKELYEKLSEEYDEAIAIHVSSKLSGTISSSNVAKEQTNFEVKIIDSYSLSFAITELIYKGLSCLEQGMDTDKVVDILSNEVKKSRNLILLGNLEQLYKGGRMSGTQLLLGNLLQIKPVLTIKTDGELDVYQRIRTEKKAKNRMLEIFLQSVKENQVQRVGIMHGNDLAGALALKAKLVEEIPELEIIIGEISSSLIVHAGQGTIGVFWQEG